MNTLALDRYLLLTAWKNTTSRRLLTNATVGWVGNTLSDGLDMVQKNINGSHVASSKTVKYWMIG
jgi:hypothetical protein